MISAVFIIHQWIFHWYQKEVQQRTRPNGEYKIAGGIVWEMEIVSEDNFQIEEKQDDDKKCFEEIFANMKEICLKGID